MKKKLLSIFIPMAAVTAIAPTVLTSCSGNQFGFDFDQMACPDATIKIKGREYRRITGSMTLRILFDRINDPINVSQILWSSKKEGGDDWQPLEHITKYWEWAQEYPDECSSIDIKIENLKKDGINAKAFKAIFIPR